MMKTIAALLARTTLSEAALFEVEDNGASGKVDLATLRKAIVPNGVPDTAPLQSQIDTHTTQISQLNDTFGSATAAKASADQAEATRVSTVQIKGQTEQSASDALAARDRAVAAANNAESQIVTLGNDGIITKHEKITVLIPQDTRLEALYNTLDPIAADLGITTERTAATNARASWIAYRNGLDRWNDITIDTPVIRADLRTAVGNYADSLETLAGKISGQGAIVLTSDGEAFVFTDGVADNPAQSITLTVTRQNSSEAVTWTTSPVVALTGTGDSRSLSIADFGANRQVVVTVTGNTSRAKDQITLVRLEKSTAVAGAGTSGQFTPIAGSAAIEKVGNRHKKTGGVHNSWDAGMVAPGLPGTAYVSGVPIVASTGWAVGLALDTEAGGFLDTEQKYLAVFRSDAAGAAHVITIKSNGAQIATATFAAATLRTFALAYDGVKVYGVYDGVVRCSAAADAGLILFPKTMHYHVGNGLTDVLYGPYTDNAFDAAKMGPLAPANNATVGAPAGTSVGSTPAETVEARANDPAARVNAAATLLNATKMQYGPGVLVSDKEPAEAGAEKTAGKDLSVLVGRTADKLTYVTGGATVDSLKPAEAGAEKTAGKDLSVLVGRTADNIAESAARKWAAESGATVGGDWGSNVVNRPANLAELAGGEGIRNILVSINEDGTLGGAGAGQVAALKLPDASALSTNAQSTSSLFFNQAFDLAKPGTTPARPQGPIALSANTATRVDTRLGYVGGTVGGDFAIGVGGSNGDTRVYLPMFRLNPKSRYRCRGRVKAASATASGLYINWQEYDAEPGTKVQYIAPFIDASGEMVVSTRGRSTASAALNAGNAGIENAPLTAAYQDFSIEMPPTATAKFASIQIMRWSGMSAVELHFENLVIEEIAPASLADLDATVNTKVAAIEEGADKTAGKDLSVLVGRTADKLTYVTGGATVDSLKPAEGGAQVPSNVGYGPATITIECDHQGAALSGQLPRAEIYKLIKDGTALTAGVTWTYQVLAGTINGFTNASAAQALSGAGSTSFEVASLGTNEARVHIIGVEGGRTRKLEVLVRKNLAPPPAAGSSGGGTSASDSTLASIAGDAWTVLSDELTVTLGSAATSVSLSAGSIELRATAALPVGTWDVAFKWEWWNGTAWAIVGTEAYSDPDPTVEYDAETATYLQFVGSITCNRTQTGLTAGSTHKFRLLGRHTTAAATKNINVTGTVSAQG